MKKKELEIIENLMKACVSLMDEVVGKKATDWGLVNDSMVAGGKAIDKAKKS